MRAAGNRRPRRAAALWGLTAVTVAGIVAGVLTLTWPRDGQPPTDRTADAGLPADDPLPGPTGPEARPADPAVPSLDLPPPGPRPPGTDPETARFAPRTDRPPPAEDERDLGPPPDGPPPDGIDDIAGQVALLRGLPYDGGLDARVVPAEVLGARFNELAFDDLDPEAVEAQRRLLVALRLLEPGDDLLGLLRALYSEQVLGMYVPKEDRLYIGGTRSALTPYQRLTAAHEVQHALQDRAWDLDEVRDLPPRDWDASRAVLGLIEGDAVLVQEAWSGRHQSAAERAEARDEIMRRPRSVLDNAPQFLRDRLFFPYREGARFVTALIEGGGWEAVDAAFVSPPTTTAEIMQPERYPRPAEVIQIHERPGPGWRSGVVATFGALDTRQVLRPAGATAAADAARAWSGAEVRSWYRGDDDAVAVALLFDTVESGSSACATVVSWYRAVSRAEGDAPPLQGDRDAFMWRCAAREVRFALAPDAATAGRLAGERLGAGASTLSSP